MNASESNENDFRCALLGSAEIAVRLYGFRI